MGGKEWSSLARVRNCSLSMTQLPSTQLPMLQHHRTKTRDEKTWNTDFHFPTSRTYGNLVLWLHIGQWFYSDDSVRVVL